MLKYKIHILLIIIIIIILPSLSMITNFYYLFASLAVVMILIISILLLSVPLYIRISLVLCIAIYYRNNIILTSKIMINGINMAYFNPISKRLNDDIPRTVSNNIFSSQFKLHKEFEKFPSHPTILVCNYCTDRVENIACMMFPTNISIMMRDGLKQTMKFHRIVKWPIFTKAKGNYLDTKNQVLENIKQGRSIFTYVSSYPSLRPEYISKLRSGMFSIAKELNVSVTPVCVDYIDTYFGAITNQNFRIRVGDTFMIDDTNISIQKTKKFFKETMKEFKKRKYEGI